MIGTKVKSKVAQSSYTVARRGLIAAQEAIVAARAEKTHAALRPELAEVVVVAAKIRRREPWEKAFAVFADLLRIAETRSTGSPHLRVLRALGVDATAPSLKRYADVVEV